MLMALVIHGDHGWMSPVCAPLGQLGSQSGIAL